MTLTRKEFLQLSGRAALGAGALSSFDFLWPHAGLAEALQDAQIAKIHQYIAAHKEEHVAKVQADLRQPSVSGPPT